MSDAIRLHKEIAMGKSVDTGASSAGDHPGRNGVTHVDEACATAGPMSDAERAVTKGVSGSPRAYDRQAAPDHGTLTDHFKR